MRTSEQCQASEDVRNSLVEWRRRAEAAEAEVAALRERERQLIEKLVHESRELVYGMHSRTKRLPDYADFRECFKKALSAAPEVKS